MLNVSILLFLYFSALVFCVHSSKRVMKGCIFSEAIFLYSHIPTLNSEFLPLLLALNTWRLKDRFFFNVIVLWVNVCMHSCVWDEPLNVPYLQAKKQLLSFCVCVFGKSWVFFQMFCSFQLHYFFHIPTICVLQTWNQHFVLNLVITNSFTIHFPLPTPLTLFFFCSSPMLYCAISLHMSQFLFYHWWKFASLQERQAGKTRGLVYTLCKGTKYAYGALLWGRLQSGWELVGQDQRRGQWHSWHFDRSLLYHLI